MKKFIVTFLFLACIVLIFYWIHVITKYAIGTDLKIVELTSEDKEEIKSTSYNIQSYKEKYGEKKVNDTQATKDGIVLPTYQEVQDIIKQLNDRKIKTFNATNGVLNGALDALDKELK